MKHHVNAIIGDNFWQVVKEEKLQEGDFEVESLMSFGGSHCDLHRSPEPIDRRAPLTYRVQMPKIDVERLNPPRPKSKPSENPPEIVRTPLDDGVDPMEVDRVHTGRTLRKRKEKVAKHLKRETNEKEKESFRKKVRSLFYPQIVDDLQKN
ncbi:hypothetical protein F2Q69_00047200 [Brassica cretica]|uniref:Uncharacterized protein n=1 Tax=Brassica cretica TaxID=69181 RepID=A0A8S9PIM8_BRACR|nr:hypothetical protein F2Q69_00047200 [Brassica cretica]